MVRGTFSPARAWRPTVGAPLARTLGLMNPTESDLAPFPETMRAYRNELRVAGYELVRFVTSFAHQSAIRVRHPIADYEFGIHKIETIDPNGQIHINPNTFFSSEERVPDWTKHYCEKERPQGFGVIKGFFSDPARSFVTLLAPPFGLALLGLAAIGDRTDARGQNERRRTLASLSETPKFIRPYSRHEA